MAGPSARKNNIAKNPARWAGLGSYWAFGPVVSKKTQLQNTYARENQWRFCLAYAAGYLVRLVAMREGSYSDSPIQWLGWLE